MFLLGEAVSLLRIASANSIVPAIVTCSGPSCTSYRSARTCRPSRLRVSWLLFAETAVSANYAVCLRKTFRRRFPPWVC
jgi:hypothetical protein